MADAPVLGTPVAPDEDGEGVATVVGGVYFSHLQRVVDQVVLYKSK